MRILPLPENVELMRFPLNFYHHCRVHTSRSEYQCVPVVDHVHHQQSVRKDSWHEGNSAPDELC